MSLRTQLTLWCGALVGVSLVAFGSLLYLVLKTSLEGRLDEALSLRAEQVARGLRLGPNGVLEAADLTPGLLSPVLLSEATGPDRYVQVYNERAELIGTSGPRLPIDPEVLLAALRRNETLSTLPIGGGRSVRLLTRPLVVGGRTVGVIQVGDALDGIEVPLRQVRDIAALGSLAALAAACLGGLWLGGRAVGPVRRVSALARRIATTGNYAQRVPPRRTADEIGELVTTFNTLIERVEHSLNEQQRLLADTSHELRSPLTVIRADLALLRRDTDPATRAECLQEAEEEAARMSRLITDLLLLAQEPGADILDCAPVAVDSLLLEVAEQARALAGGRTVVVGDGQTPAVLADRDRLKQALWNLVDNALRYTEPGGTVRLSARAAGGWVELMVEDDGVGIPAAHLPRVFERFYRVDRARSRATGGTGLGLAIVKHIARAHGGRTEVASEVGKGSTFVLKLPLMVAASAAAEPPPAGAPGYALPPGRRLRATRVTEVTSP